MRRFYIVVVAISAIVVLNSPFSFAYEKELKSISTNMSEKIARAEKKTVAVVDFTDLQGNVTELGRFIAEEFSVALADADKGFEVVDRTHLQTLLKEHKLSTTGIIDPSTAKKLGEIAGVDALVTGTITPFGDSVRISIKILDTSTARVIGASSGEIAKTKAIEELLARGIDVKMQFSTTPSTTLTKIDVKVQQRVEVNDFTFEVRECKRMSEKVLCYIAIVNNDQKEKEIGIGGKGFTCAETSLLYDNIGNSYSASEIQFGAKSGPQDVWQSIPPQLPVIAVLRFDDVSQEAQSVSIRLGCSEKNCKRFFPVMRNIPLNR